jgi:hypothetical protein
MTKTKTQQQKENLGARAWYTAGRMMDWKCPECGATGLDMHNVCAAPLARPCPGFTRTEEVHQEFERNHDALVNT